MAGRPPARPCARTASSTSSVVRGMKGARQSEQSDAEASLGVMHEGGGLLAGVDAELVERGREVALDRALREVELIGDLRVAVARGDHADDLALTRGERRPVEVAAQLPRKAGLAGADRADGDRQ